MRALHLLAAATVALSLLSAPSAFAATEKVPVDLGLGPAAYHFFGAIGEDQPVHFGLKISLEAVIDQQMIRRNQRKVPANYRKMARDMNEVRYSPSVFIPDALIISPKYKDTGIYGITWRPLGLGLPLLTGRVRLSVGAGLLLTYAFIHTDLDNDLPAGAPAPAVRDTHFVRPGLDLGAELEIALTKSFLISLGWSSGLYVPQTLGSFGMDLEKLDESIWHVGQAFLQLHFRFPYTVKL
ncbi:MAG: hypothetical protein ACOX6T_21405 [Myxococcales bacterium]|jgi:hypothetical protein